MTKQEQMRYDALVDDVEYYIYRYENGGRISPNQKKQLKEIRQELKTYITPWVDDWIAEINRLLASE
ncbi:MAG: hypothetical protein K5685_09720 [Bacteroidales bacterium]|nr:hypothetical protein [Bacteroidales bacterium]